MSGPSYESLSSAWIFHNAFDSPGGSIFGWVSSFARQKRVDRLGIQKQILPGKKVGSSGTLYTTIARHAPRLSLLPCFLFLSMTICIVSIRRGGIDTSTGSDLTGVRGGEARRVFVDKFERAVV